MSSLEEKKKQNQNQNQKQTNKQNPNTTKKAGFISFRWNFNQDPPQGGEMFAAPKFARREWLCFTPTGPVRSHEWPRAALTLSLRLCTWSFAKSQK